MSILLALGRIRQEGFYEVKRSIGYIAGPRSDAATW